ncbi:hypothetical protein [Rheinheimera pacifica]|uniref:hypothetical protein n=1 Tax=Rheinheimera pacifica TaxID=173990 RepID=UPI002ED986D2
MNIIEETLKLHSQAWRDHSQFTECLEKAARLLQQVYESGAVDSLIVNNYAAVLLDLHRDAEARELLQAHSPEFSEFCSNYAIAIAKSAYDISLIRQWNQAASRLPKRQGAIVAYMDWQSL